MSHISDQNHSPGATFPQIGGKYDLFDPAMKPVKICLGLIGRRTVYVAKERVQSQVSRLPMATRGRELIFVIDICLTILNKKHLIRLQY